MLYDEAIDPITPQIRDIRNANSLVSGTLTTKSRTVDHFVLALARGDFPTLPLKWTSDPAELEARRKSARAAMINRRASLSDIDRARRRFV